MKQKIIYCKDLEVKFYIGQNSKDNFDVIDKGFEDDLWFHSKNNSSCHVVALLPHNISDKEMIIREGAILCKMNTNKLKNIKNVPIIYTEIKNVIKTKQIGMVLTKDTKTIII